MVLQEEAEVAVAAVVAEVVAVVAVVVAWVAVAVDFPEDDLEVGLEGDPVVAHPDPGDLAPAASVATRPSSESQKSHP